MRSYKWSSLSDKVKYGVAICNFSQEGSYKIKITVGDTLYIYEDCEGWYYVYHTRDKIFGIVPASYVSIKLDMTDKTGNYLFSHDPSVNSEPPIVQEMTSILREWGVIWKNLYLNQSQDFEAVRHMINELIDWRKQILSGTLPMDELKELKHKVTASIDFGNMILGLDLVVRDDQGNILSSETTSIIDLYRAHEDATLRVKEMGSHTQSMPSSIHYCHNLFVDVKNFVCRIGDDADLLITLYDAKEGRFFSENYLVRWSKEGLAKNLDQLHNLIVLFIDLGSKDLSRERVFLVCQIIRIGTMALKANDNKKVNNSHKKSSENLRRPFGVAVMDITEIINGRIDVDEEKQHFIPFIQCGERDFLDNVIRKAINAKDVPQKETKEQGLWVCLKLLHGDLKQVSEENPHLVSSFTSLARKMGFPEVILPGDVRNDLYLTLVQGEFSRVAKSSDRNIEVTVGVYNEKGQMIKGVISIGAGSDFTDQYRSVIYYHEDKPKWMETFKVAIPIEEFYNAHLKFTFKHRSSNEAKDKAEKPYCMSFVKLMQENGTTLKDENHELLVYKLDHKRREEGDVGYLALPSTRQELENHPTYSSRSSIQIPGLTLSPKESFIIFSIVCSTKLTQNVDLLGLLKWWSNKESLESNLTALMKVDGEEVVKFLQDTLDALFSILMENSDSDQYDKLIFEALIFIMGLISDRKYQHFRPVLDLYIKETFSATLAYNKLMMVLKQYVDNANQQDIQDTLLKAMKCLEYIFRFIVRSRQLFAALNEGNGRQLFEASLKQLLSSITGMMLYSSDVTLLVQGACLKYFPFTIPDILSVFDKNELSQILTNLIETVPEDRLTKQKMMCVNDIVHSELFKMPECRLILMPMIHRHIKELLEKKEEEELCIKILSDELVVLSSKLSEPSLADVTEVVASMLRTVVQTVINGGALAGRTVAVMLAIFRIMTPYHYTEYIRAFSIPYDILDFLMEILLVFRDLFSKSVFPSDWSEMILLQNSIILKALRYFATTIIENFTNPFEYQVWNNFFHCAISFLTQKPLQLENFSETKRQKIISKYKDMRRDTGFEIRKMWFHLALNKKKFVPGMVGPFLEMTLIPEPELRKATIPIFFDMMNCEFYANFKADEHDAHFNEFENEMITQLDILVEGGRGDDQYRSLFLEILGNLCENHPQLHKSGMKFVQTVVRLLKRLLEYRTIITDENKESRMSCTVSLLEFYNLINRKELYIRYLYKLCDLHLECENYVEAAFALKLHSKLLRWTDDSLPQILRNDKHPHCETHRELKEKLYLDIINYFDKGKLWEAGLTLCKELAAQYENEVYEYVQLGELYRRMATFYEHIMKQVRPEPEYFRVGYYGRGFPAFLQNKVFIYRGKPYERLSEFSSRLLDQFPLATVMTSLAPPSEELMESTTSQYLQINKVDPIMSDNKFRHKNTIAVHEQIVNYYRVNEVKRFTYSRPSRRKSTDSERQGSGNNEFGNMWLERTTLVTSYSLPGILQWFPVTDSQTIEISPIENAMETMETTNSKIFHLVRQHYRDPTLPLNPLSMLLNGVVDAAVMGGISNYEKAFFTDDYISRNSSPKDIELINKLKETIAKQIPILEAGIIVHKARAAVSLQLFHEHLEDAFGKLKAHVEEKYGKQSMPEDLQEHNHLSLRRTKTLPLNNIATPESTLRKTFISNLSLSGSSTKSSPTSRAQSIWVRPNSGNKTLTKKLRNDTSRRSSGVSLENESQSKWYDKAESPVFELHEPLTPQRPLRSEVEKRKSRPPSGHFRAKVNTSPTRSPINSQVISPPGESGDDKPPPLPIKQAYADYTNLPDENQYPLGPRKSTLTLTLRPKNKPPPPLPEPSLSPPEKPHYPGTPTTPPMLPKKPQRVESVDLTAS